jgi:hypothetical protein
MKSAKTLTPYVEDTDYNMPLTIGSGITVGGGVNITSIADYVTANLVLNLDAGLTSSFSGNTTWRDTVNGLSFTLSGSPTFSSNNGGYLNFVPSSSQYASSGNQSFGSLTRWTVEAWHYYTGNNSGSLPSLISETYPGVTSRINFNLGTVTQSGLQNGYFDGNWRLTSAYALTSNAWYHIIGTYDGATIKLFVNNIQVASTAFVGTPASSQGGIRLMRRWDLGDYWGGRLGVVRIYNTALGNVQIDQNYQAVRSRYGL